jgi:hypothetical protein
LLQIPLSEPFATQNAPATHETGACEESQDWPTAASAMQVDVAPELQNAPRAHAAPDPLQSPPTEIAAAELTLALHVPAQHVLLLEQAPPSQLPETHSSPL